MRASRHVNPDHHLETPNGRVWSVERGKQAWESAYAELETFLRAVGAEGTLYVLCGLQGSGKTTWIARNPARLGDGCLAMRVAQLLYQWIQIPNVALHSHS